MIRIKSYGIAATILVMQVASYGFGSPQADANRPLTCDQVKEYLNAEKSGTLPSGITAKRIEQFGVDFQPESPCGVDLIRREPNLRDPIRNNVKITTLTIQCEPVECNVRINNEPEEKTFGTVLTKAGVMPGPVTVTVSASGFQTKTVEVQLSPGQHLTLPRFKMEPAKGRLNVTCGPKDQSEEQIMPECSIQTGRPNEFAGIAATIQHRLSLDLVNGQYNVQVQALGYKTESKTIYVAPDHTEPLDIKLDADPCARLTPLQVFDGVVDSLGGKPILTTGARSMGTAKMTLNGDPPTIGMVRAQVVEYAAYTPGRLRWDLKIAGTNWAVVFDGSKATSKGEQKYKGTEFAQELEESIRLFSALRLPSILPFIRGKTDIKHSCSDTEVIMTAESPEDRYTFHLSKEYSPLKLLHEHLTAPKSREEIEFGQYKPIGQDLMLPHVMILRYPDRPKHEQIFEYDKIDVGAQFKDSEFKP